MKLIIGLSLIFAAFQSSNTFAASCGGYCAGTTYHWCYYHPLGDNEIWREYPNSPKCKKHELTEVFTGVKCGPAHHKTGDRECCHYVENEKGDCWVQ